MKGATDRHPQEEGLRQAMRLSQQGDAQAYRELLGRVRILVQAYAARALRRMGLEDDRLAEDLTQEILLAVHRKRQTYDPSQLFTPWLFAIARYKVIDFARSRRREGTAVALDAIADTLAAPATAAGVADDLQRLLAELPEKQRQALEMVKLEGLSIAEASERTRMSASAVKVTVHRALKSLKKQIGGGDDGTREK
jgi:RNA polymerase sigma-70 factor (ECF subfamily)